MAALSSAVPAAVMTALCKSRNRPAQATPPALDQTSTQDQPIANEALQRELARARKLPESERLLENLQARSRITPRDLAEFSRRLDGLERKTLVDDARKDVVRQRLACIARRLATEVVAKIAREREQKSDSKA